jgi:hypothetical protein
MKTSGIFWRNKRLKYLSVVFVETKIFQPRREFIAVIHQSHISHVELLTITALAAW